MFDLADPGRASSPAGDDSGAVGDEKSNCLQPDPSGRAGDETPLAVESEIHSRG
jgi:hypothetical protein